MTSEALTIARGSAAAVEGRGETILVVEDDAGVARLQRKQLERAGYRVVTATSGEEALRQVEQGRVDLILLDYRLPSNHTGLEFYEEIKAAGYPVPVIMVTGFSDEATVIKALRSGVRDFVTKSVEYLDYLPEAAARVLKQVRTERRLAESETRLASVIDSAKDAIILTAADQRVTLFNAAAERMFRCPAAEAVGQPLTRFIPKECRAAAESPDGLADRLGASLTQTIRSGSRGVRADGGEFPLEASVSPVAVGGQKFYTVIVRDVTERQRTETLLREQAALLDNAQDAIVVRDVRDTIVYWNRGAQRLYGWTAAEAVGRNAREALSERPLPELEEAGRAVLERGRWSGELLQTTKGGREVVVESRWTLVRDEEGRPKGKLVINTDVTEKKKLEAQLVQAQRMEGIGVLAGGVAHDFNNLLTVITGFSEMLLAGLRPGDPSHAALREIRKAGERAAGLTRQLLAFSRKQVLQVQVLDLNLLVADTEKMLRRLIGEDIDLATLLDPALGRVKADPGQIEQVIMNLVVNARDAMPTGGHLTIETRNVEAGPDSAALGADVGPGPCALLAVSDTGCGMDEATKARIFEPFFTTKGPGKGTGLGLATVYGIVKQSGGHIQVCSEPGHGSTFKIYLPRLGEDANGSGEASTGLRPIPRGTEAVLLAEDEDGVRALARLALQSYGYTVLEAGDGDEALRLGLEHAGPIHLLITDVVMPKLSGRRLADQLGTSRPGMKVLYLSGYTDDAVARHGALEAGTALLQKPFTPAVLARKVREVLDGK